MLAEAFAALAAADTNTAHTAAAAAAAAALTDTNTAHTAAAALISLTAARAAATKDYDRLLKLNLGAYPEIGEPIDPTESGPLGQLWPEVEPDWYTKGKQKFERVLTEASGNDETPEVLGVEDAPQLDPELSLEISIPDSASDEEVIEMVKQLVARMDKHHRALGGEGIEVDSLEIFGEVFEEVPR